MICFWLRGEERGEGEGEPGAPNDVQDQRAQLMRRPSAPALPADPAFTPLPPNWEMAKDVQGRTYYIDHVNKTTQWVIHEQKFLPVKGKSWC